MHSRRFGLYRRNRRIRKRTSHTRARKLSRSLIRGRSRLAMASFRRRLLKSTSRIGRRIKHVGRKSFRRRPSTLRSRPYGKINTIYKYRQNGRRAHHLSKRFKTKVAEHSGHQLQYQTFTNVFGSAVGGDCAWFMLDLGHAADVSSFLDFAARNYAGFGVADPNVTAHTVNQWGLRVNVLNHTLTGTYFNCSENSKIEVTTYPCYLKQDVWGFTAFTPLALIQGEGITGELTDSASASPPVYQDVSYTPFRCPALMGLYRVGRPKKFVVHAGGRFDVSIQNSYRAQVVNSSDYGVIGTSLTARKGQYKAVLVKVVGQLGIMDEGSGVKTVRNMPVDYAGRVREKATVVASRESRDIHMDTNSTTRPFPGGTTYTAEEELMVVNAQVAVPPTSTA